MDIDVKQLLAALCEIPAVSGFEALSAEALDAVALKYFDEVIHTPVGNHIYVKRCGKPNAKKFLLDAHFDEIGFLVSDIIPSAENGGDEAPGFLRFVTIGGVDTRILSSAEVTVWGKQAIPGVISSTPPHLQKSGDSEKLPEVESLFIDTGFSIGKLKTLAPIGTTATFTPRITELKNGRITGKSLDDKVCIAAVIQAVSMLEPAGFGCDVYALFSAMEETGGTGAMTGTYAVDPDYAIALDVDFARGPDTPKHKSSEMGSGPSIALSMASDRVLTQKLIDYALEKNMPLQKIVEAKYTGTNGDLIHLTREGVPVAVISIPLRYMHSASECIDAADITSTAKLIAGFICEGGTV